VSQEIYYRFLDRLYYSGRCNLYYAAKELVKTYGVSAGTARKVLIAWMKNKADMFLKKEGEDNEAK